MNRSHRPLAPAILSAALGLAAAADAQSTMSSTVTFALGYTEGPGGNGNTIIEPGESAVLHLTVSFSNQNTTGTYAPFPPGPGSGTIRGFASGFIDLNGSATNGGNAQGAWNVDQNGSPPYGTNPSWDLVGSSGWGTPVNPGARLINVQFGQFPDTAVQTTNPIVEDRKSVV